MIIYVILLIAGVFLILLSACGFFALIVFNLCFTRAKSPEDNTEKTIRLIEKGGGNADVIRSGKAWMLSQEAEHHYITSRDGLKLHGIFIRNVDSDSNRVAVMVHGYQGTLSIDFSQFFRGVVKIQME